MGDESRETAKRKGKAGAGPKKNSRSAPPAKKQRVTIADIARHAGVSPTAVSITLTDRRDIVLSEATRDRIKRSADKLGYFPNRLGEGFFRGRSKLIGLLMLSDSYRPFLSCLAGIDEGLASVDCFPLLMSPNWMDGHLQRDSGDSRNRAGELSDLRRLLEYQVDGILYFSIQTEHAAACAKELAKRKIPMVILGGVDPCGGAVDVVGGDNEEIGRMAAEHLLSVGCTSFIFGRPAFSHPLDAVVRSSFAARLAAAGYACSDLIVNVEEPGELSRLLSRLARPPVGFFCTYDDIAALALRASFSIGWWVPRDFAVVTMGETVLARFNLLPITTVNRNSFTAGETAAKLLVQRVEGLAGKAQRILIPPSLEARQSSVSDVSWLLRSDAAPVD